MADFKQTGIKDIQNNKDVAVTAFREFKTITPVRLVGTAFSNSTKDTNFWTETVTGSGAVTQAGQISLATGTTANSTAKYASVRKARFVPSSVSQLRTIARFTTAGTANNVRRIGAYDANEGFFFQLSGTTFSVGSRKAASDTLVNSGSFNGAAATYTLDTNVHRFIIEYTNLSAQFYIDDVLVHTISSATDPLTNTLTLPITFENNNSGGSTSAVVFDVRVANIVRLGNLQTESIYKRITTAATTVCKYGAGVLHHITLGIPTGTSLTIYDNTEASGSIISVVNTPAQANPTTLNYDLPFSTGLTIVSVGTWDATIVYE